MKPKQHLGLNQRSVLAALLGSLLLARPTVATAQDVADFNYTTNADGATITITGLSMAGILVTNSPFDFPSAINDLPVTTIGDNWHIFNFSYHVNAVNFPDSVISIGDNAFSSFSGQMTNLVIPDSVLNLGTNSFPNLRYLTTLTIGNGLAYIPYDAFSSCRSLQSVTLGSSVTNIGDFAFGYAASLTNITIRGDVTRIGQHAFEGAGKLTQFAFGNSLVSIGQWAFSGCALTSIALPNSLTTIGDSAFTGNGWLSRVTIGNGITNIGNKAFIFAGSMVGNLSVFFTGNAPDVGTNVFSSTANPKVYYLPGATGWSNTFCGFPAFLWNPTPQPPVLQGNLYGFDITGTTNIPLVVEGSTALNGSAWTPLQSYSLTNGLIHFSEPAWTSSPARFYRIRSP